MRADRTAALLTAASAGMLCVCLLSPDHYLDHHPQENFRYGASPRSPQWGKVRGLFIQHPEHNRCEWQGCGSRTDLNVHHIIPFSRRPDLELEFANLITLCRRHHLEIGHRCEDGSMNWRCDNPDVARESGRKHVWILEQP